MKEESRVWVILLNYRRINNNGQGKCVKFVFYLKKSCFKFVLFVICSNFTVGECGGCMSYFTLRLSFLIYLSRSVGNHTPLFC